MSIQQKMDLSGKLVIKAQLGDDIRCIPIHNEDITYDELVLMMQRVFRGQLKGDDDLTLKYKDGDGDLITIFDSSDLAFAIEYSRILKLTIFVNGATGSSSATSLKHADVAKIRQGLKDVRNRVNQLLDMIEPVQDLVNGKSEGGKDSKTHVASGSGEGVASREFDPLQEHGQNASTRPEDANDAVNKFRLKEEASDRSGTPDSIASGAGSQSASSVLPGGTYSNQGLQQPQPQPQPQPQGQPQAQQQPQAGVPYQPQRSYPPGANPFGAAPQQQMGYAGYPPSSAPPPASYSAAGKTRPMNVPATSPVSMPGPAPPRPSYTNHQYMNFPQQQMPGSYPDPNQGHQQRTYAEAPANTPSTTAAYGAPHQQPQPQQWPGGVPASGYSASPTPPTGGPPTAMPNAPGGTNPYSKMAQYPPPQPYR